MRDTTGNSDEQEKAQKDRRRIKEFEQYIYKGLGLEEARDAYIKRENLDSLKAQMNGNTGSINENELENSYQQALSKPNAAKYLSKSLETDFDYFLSTYQLVFCKVKKNVQLHDNLFAVASNLRSYVAKEFKPLDPAVVHYIENNNEINGKFTSLFSAYEDMFGRFNHNASFVDKVEIIFSKVEQKNGAIRAPEDIEKPEDSARFTTLFSWYQEIFGKFDERSLFGDKIKEITAKLSHVNEEKEEQLRKEIKQYLTNLQRDQDQDRSLWDKIKHFPLNLRSTRTLDGKKEDGKLLEKLQGYEDLGVAAVGILLAEVKGIDADDKAHKKKEITPLIVTALKETLDTLKE